MISNTNWTTKGRLSRVWKFEEEIRSGDNEGLLNISLGDIIEKSRQNAMDFNSVYKSRWKSSRYEEIRGFVKHRRRIISRKIAETNDKRNAGT